MFCGLRPPKPDMLLRPNPAVAKAMAGEGGDGEI